MRASVFGPAIPIILLAACAGADGASIALRGDFGEMEGDAPTRVLAVEGQREAEVAAGAFEFPELTAGPVTLLVLSGPDTLGTMAIGNLPAGSELTLTGIRVDPATRLAFPRTLDGARTVLVNGLRMGPNDGISGRVDEPGIVLAISEAADALLLRPDDARIPDLRVVVSPATVVATPDGDPVRVEAIAAGDSVRVLGESERGLVLADSVVVPRRTALVPVSDRGREPDERTARDEPRAESREGGGSRVREREPTPDRSVPVVLDRRRPEDEPRGRGSERSNRGGEGKGKGKKN